MKKVILIYGLIAGTIVSAMMLITMPMYQSGSLNMDNGELVGYTTMVIALAMVFFGIKSYRDNYGNGVISFGAGFKVGILITLIASLMYALSWEITYPRVGADLINKMTEQSIDELKKEGASEAELQKEKEKWADFTEMYKIPVVRFGMTLLEILPVGLVITLVSAGILRRKEILPAT